jgi:phage repressor protein C with HTH and peptisase S24 domain
VKVDDMNLKQFPDRVLYIINQYKSVSNLARLIKLSESVVRKWRDGKSDPSRENLLSLANVSGVSIEWLVAGTGAIYPNGTDLTSDSEEPEFAFIRDYEAQLTITGNGGQATQSIALRHQWLKHRGLNEKDLVMVFTKGDSMEPTISDNNTLIVDTSDTEPQDGGIYAIRNDGHLLVKRTQVAVGQGVWLISDNKEYKEQLVRFEDTLDLDVIGRVVWIGKDI